MILLTTSSFLSYFCVLFLLFTEKEYSVVRLVVVSPCGGLAVTMGPVVGCHRRPVDAVRGCGLCLGLGLVVMVPAG